MSTHVLFGAPTVEWTTAGLSAGHNAALSLDTLSAHVCSLQTLLARAIQSQSIRQTLSKLSNVSLSGDWLLDMFLASEAARLVGQAIRRQCHGAHLQEIPRICWAFLHITMYRKANDGRTHGKKFSRSVSWPDLPNASRWKP